MNKLLLIAFLLCSAFSFGQPNGAPTPQDAWGDSTASSFWFEFKKVINVDGDEWLDKSPSSKLINFNTSIGMEYSFSFLNTLDYFQTTFDVDYETDWIDGSLSGFEEWFVLRIPTTRNITISIDLNENSTGSGGEVVGTTLMFYSIIDKIDFNYRLSNGDFLDDTNIQYFHAESYGEETETIKNIELSESLSSSNGNFSNDANFILMRIGNNDESYGDYDLLIHKYKLKLYTNNEKCENALKLPVNDGSGSVTSYTFSSTTNKTLLTSNYPDISVKAGSNNFYGGNEYDTNTGGFKGIWFRAAELDSNIMYVATCGSIINPQLLVFKQCAVGADIFIAGENMNVDNIDASLNANFNSDWNRDICLIPENNANWPVIKYPNDGTEYFYYLFGDFDGDFNIMAFHDNNLNGGPVLPVEWLGFDGSPVSLTNLLQWSTASEDRNDYFLLEKSVDGENYNELGRIQGAGNSIFEKTYSFIDENPYYLTYYRIAQVDYDGTLNYGPQIVVVNESIFFRCSILKQPVDDGLLKIEIDVAEEMEVEVAIYSLSGHQLFDAKYMLVENKNSIEINTSHLVDGVYILKINNRMHQFTKKIIIQSLK